MFFTLGAGKGTHGPKIEDMLGCPQLSTGDMLRAAVANKTEVGKKADAVMKAGGLVSDDIVVGIIRDRIQEEDCKFGFILVRCRDIVVVLFVWVLCVHIFSHSVDGAGRDHLVTAGQSPCCV